MKYYKLEPEVAGGIGKESQIIYTEEGRIKEITFLDYYWCDKIALVLNIIK